MGRVLEGRELGVGHVVFTVHSFTAAQLAEHIHTIQSSITTLWMGPGDTFELLDTVQENDGHLLEL